MINFPGGPYRPPRRAHDVHTICPWCGAEKSSACEFEAGFCPWVGDEPEPEPEFSSPVPECAVWLRRATYSSEVSDD